MTIRCVIWCAVSTKEQTAEDKNSLINQEQEARFVCQQNGWEIVAVLLVPGFSRYYIDIHECARDMAREGISAFYELIELWNRRAFDVLICRDGDRFARTQSLHAYTVERTIDIGARIYSIADGWIDKSNSRMWISMSGYKAASEIDTLIKRREIGMDIRAQRGLPPAIVPMSHTLIRDSNSGRALYLEVDEAKRRLWSDLAALILEGVGWVSMEPELYQRFGHVNPKTGEMWSEGTFYNVVHNPIFWGHTARNYKKAKKRFDSWVYDSAYEPPVGVKIFRNTHPPVYSGELADLVKAELKRRHDVIKGKASPTQSHRFTGLLICGSCGWRMVARTSGWIRKSPRNDGKCGVSWRCRAYWSPSVRCQQNVAISDEDVQTYLNAFLHQVLIEEDMSLVIPQNRTYSERVLALRGEIVDLENEIKEMITQQAVVKSASIKQLYSEKIAQAGERLDILKQNLLAAQREVESPTILLSRERARHDIVNYGLDNFWKQEPRIINQLLLKFFGSYRIVVDQGKVTGIAISGH